MANAPLVGQDGGSCAFDLPDGGSEMFFVDGLDGWNRDESVEEISLSAKPSVRQSGSSPPLPLWERVDQSRVARLRRVRGSLRG